MTFWEDDMSAFSSDSGRTITDRSKTGFMKKDIETLKLFGRTQASPGAVEGTAERLKGAIKQQTAKEVITTKGGSRSGPAFEAISDVKEQEVEKLFNLFQKREESISTRRATPGIKQTRLVDR